MKTPTSSGIQYLQPRGRSTILEHYGEAPFIFTVADHIQWLTIFKQTKRHLSQSSACAALWEFRHLSSSSESVPLECRLMCGTDRLSVKCLYNSSRREPMYLLRGEDDGGLPPRSHGRRDNRTDTDTDISSPECL